MKLNEVFAKKTYRPRVDINDVMNIVHNLRLEAKLWAHNRDIEWVLNKDADSWQQIVQALMQKNEQEALDIYDRLDTTVQKYGSKFGSRGTEDFFNQRHVRVGDPKGPPFYQRTAGIGESFSSKTYRPRKLISQLKQLIKNDEEHPDIDEIEQIIQYLSRGELEEARLAYAVLDTFVQSHILSHITPDTIQILDPWTDKWGEVI